MMHIPVLNQLETRSQWISFFRRERPYAYITQPLCLIDLQTTYLQVTLLKENMLDGRQATKYSLGAKSSLVPIWKMLKGCNWQLSIIIDGLTSLEFTSNARDNAFPGIHRDLTVRKFFSKDKQLLAPTLIGPLAPLNKEPESWSIEDICRLLSHQQFSYSEFLPHPLKPAPLRSILLKMLAAPYGWTIAEKDTEITLSYLNKPLVKIQPEIKKPAPRL